jgi:hypothetical protein
MKNSHRHGYSLVGAYIWIASTLLFSALIIAAFNRERDKQRERLKTECISTMHKLNEMIKACNASVKDPLPDGVSPLMYKWGNDPDFKIVMVCPSTGFPYYVGKGPRGPGSGIPQCDVPGHVLTNVILNGL